MWRNFINPPNHISDEEDYQSTEEEDPNLLVSPRRPHQSPRASPRALLRPDPPLVEEVLANVDRQLNNLPPRQQRAERRNEHRQAIEAAEAAAAAARAAELANMTNYDAEDKDDKDKAQELARSVKIEFDPNNIKFWFAQLEDEMEMAGIGKQWLKKSVLQRNLPTKIKEDVMGFLQLQKAEAGAHIYLDIKNELIRIYAPKPQDAYNKALSRTLAGLPSQLGYQIINDICRKPVKLDACCCAV